MRIEDVRTIQDGLEAIKESNTNKEENRKTQQQIEELEDIRKRYFEILNYYSREISQDIPVIKRIEDIYVYRDSTSEITTNVINRTITYECDNNKRTEKLPHDAYIQRFRTSNTKNFAERIFVGRLKPQSQNTEIRSLIKDITDTAYVLGTTRITDVFVSFYPHTNQLDVRIYPCGWSSGYDPKAIDIKLNDDNAIEELTNVYNTIKGLF